MLKRRIVKADQIQMKKHMLKRGHMRVQLVRHTTSQPLQGLITLMPVVQ